LDLFEIVKKTIDKWDPYGLLEINCPEDEYDCESKEIAEKINNKNSIYEIAEIISKVFTNAFDEPEIFSIENCMKIAEQIKIQIENR
jgi:hypothetical protein